MRNRSPSSPRFDAAPPSLRAILTDIDGTLTGPDRVLDLRAVAMLRALESEGTTVILATGNVLPVAVAIHRSIGLRGPIVCENGGLLYRKVEGVDEVRHL